MNLDDYEKKYFSIYEAFAETVCERKKEKAVSIGAPKTLTARGRILLTALIEDTTFCRFRQREEFHG